MESRPLHLLLLLCLNLSRSLVWLVSLIREILRIQTMCAQVCGILAFISILPLFGAGNLRKCLYTVSDVNIQPLGLVLDVTEDNLRVCVECDLVNLHVYLLYDLVYCLRRHGQWHTILGGGCLWSEQVLPLIDQRARPGRFSLYC